METIQLIGISPEQIQNAILSGVKNQIDELKKSFAPKEPTEYLTRNEVADWLKIDLSTLHNWTKKGKLNAYGIGSRVFYKRHEVENAIIKLEK
ncbi:MAG: helix-turn-helix domain-containing protein [Flavobacteriaceae bacterium]|nr:helix-turn-helix domain-containing protein [Flavobacteriaceae bacterium]MBS9768321.1 helix-turn-helix domain-containing protein [Flavobacteriaceae bacterium]